MSLLTGSPSPPLSGTNVRDKKNFLIFRRRFRICIEKKICPGQMSGTSPPLVRDKCPGHLLYNVQLSHYNSLPNYFSSNLYLFYLSCSTKCRRIAQELKIARNLYIVCMFFFIFLYLSLPIPSLLFPILLFPLSSASPSHPLTVSSFPAFPF